MLRNRARLAGSGAALEPLPDEVGVGVGHAHAGEDDAERGAFDGRLGGDLDGEFEVGEPTDGEDGELLAADQGGEPVDGGDAGDHRVPGHVSAGRVDGAAGDRSAEASRSRAGRRRWEHPGRC